MRGLQEADVLRLLDGGWRRGPVERALLLLEHAWPDADAETRGALPVGERDRLLIALRARTFGPRASVRAACHECGVELEAELDLERLLETRPAELRAPPAPAETGDLLESALTFDHDGREYRFRPPGSHDLLQLTAAGSTSGQQLLVRCVEPSSGHRPAVDPEPVTAEPELLSAFSAAVTEADPLADVELDLVCTECGQASVETFDVVDFLWSEIDAYGERLLREIHVLAATYGWTEREILGLGTSRRQLYLGMVTHG